MKGIGARRLLEPFIDRDYLERLPGDSSLSLGKAIDLLQVAHNPKQSSGNSSRSPMLQIGLFIYKILYCC